MPPASAGRGAPLRQADPVDAGAPRVPRPVTDDALSGAARVLQRGRADGGTFEAGIEIALRRLLVSPEFLFRVEPDPGAETAPATRVA